GWPLRRRRPGMAQRGASGRQRRPVVHPQSGDARRLRRAGALAGFVLSGPPAETTSVRSNTVRAVMKRLLVSLATLSLVACSGTTPAEPPKPAEIPITSKSPQAIDHFKKGRDLAENLRLPEAGQAMDEALKL